MSGNRGAISPDLEIIGDFSLCFLRFSLPLQPSYAIPSLYEGSINSNQLNTNMKVLKFGGSSVGSVESILSVKSIVEKEAKHGPVVVVVSALSGITDQLLATSQTALKGNDKWRTEFQDIVDRHHRLIDAVITDTKSLEQLVFTVDSLFDQLRSIFFGVYLVHELSKKSQDAIVSYGERISSHIVS